jgi:glyoxylase I family protein
MPIDVRHLAPLFQVFDMPTSLRFYCDALGCEVVTTDGRPAPEADWVLLQLNGLQLMLNTAYERDRRPAAPDPARIAAHEDASIYFACPDLDAAYAQLRAKGVNANEPRVAPYGMNQMYVTDPDGYVLCFQWRAGEQAEASTAS